MDFLSVFRSAMPILYAAAIGVVGWKMAARLRFPAPALIGSMLLMAVAMVLGVPAARVPGWLLIGAQSVIGGNIGRRVDRSAVSMARRTLPAMVVTTTWYLGATAFLAWIIARVTSIDLRTAFLATVPGGVTEMTALALATGVDSAFVATMHTFRVLATNLTVPMVSRLGFLDTRPEATPAAAAAEPIAAEPAAEHELPAAAAAPAPEPPRHAERPAPHWSINILVGLAGGLLFTAIGVPAGAVVGSMVSAAVARLAGLRLRTLPPKVLAVAYIVLGLSVGQSFDAGTVHKLGSAAFVLVLSTIAILLSSFILARIIMRVMRIDGRTAILACSPGGLSLMTVLAEETGGQPVLVSLFHLVRLVWVVLVMPLFMRFLA